MVEDISTAKQGRRRFDREAVLELALRQFWRHGYEATSMAELLKAMGIKAPSLYATFGNKEQLFLQAVAHYTATRSSLLYGSLDEPISAREAVARMLLNAADLFSAPDNPAGCFYVTSGTALSESSVYIEEQVRKRRHENEAAIRERLERAVADGELPRDAEPAKLAKYFNAVMQGISTQARDGATATELRDIAESAMAAWPRP